MSDLLHWVLARGQVGSHRLHAGLSVAASGAWSRAEAELLRLLSSSTVLPQLLANPELRDGEGHRLTTPDVWVDDVAMAIMVHSRKWHAGEREWESTVEHDTDLQAARVVVVGVTPHSIRADPAGCWNGSRRPTCARGRRAGARTWSRRRGTPGRTGGSCCAGLLEPGPAPDRAR